MKENDRRKKIVEIYWPPTLTTSNTIGRAVTFEDGNEEFQAYLVGVGWISDGVDEQSMWTGGGVDANVLKKYGYSDEAIEEILDLSTPQFFDPE